MSIYFDLRWILLVPAVLALGFMIWVFLHLAREIHRERREYVGFAPRRREKSGIWE
jgi:hypothetical protein